MEGRRQAASRDEDARVALAWYVEAFRRTKRLPALETLLGEREELAEQTPADMLHVMRSIQAAGGSVEIELVNGADYGLEG